MAKKQDSIFECQHCGAHSTKWIGKCLHCGAWESLLEINKKDIEILKKLDSKSIESNAVSIKDVKFDVLNKISSDESEFDIVLGGGIVIGGLYLIGGSPGVGKSTLLLKISNNLSKSRKVLYISGEESTSQIKLRAQRLGVEEENLYLLSAIDINTIEVNLRKEKFQVCIIDSIQTMFSSSISSSPGSVSQVRECTFVLLRIAKELQISIFIIGHITKDGAIAGPRILEHMVDCVLYFEGDPSKELRLLRCFKNRFGASNEVGIFEMRQEGLISAKNASVLFLQNKEPLSGSAISVVIEGSRPLVLEIQALVSESNYPKRSATGFELNRLNMLLALLEKKLDVPIAKCDVFINVVGGIKINETSADLALIAAIISSFKNRPLSPKSAFIGEVSLVGDIREVGNIDSRLKELESYGFANVIVSKKPKNKYNLKIFEATDVTKLLQWM